MVNNPIEERTAADGTWRPEIEKKLMKLKKLDGKRSEKCNFCLRRCKKYALFSKNPEPTLNPYFARYSNCETR